MKNKIFKQILSCLAIIVLSMNIAIAQCGSELPIVIYVNDASLATVQFSVFDDNNTLLLQGDADEIEEIFCLPEGCYTITVSGLGCTPFNFFGNSGCIPHQWSLNANDNFIAGGYNGTESFCLISGCTDSRYCNYNPEATIEDGSCTGIPGCTDNTACNYQPFADCDNGTCASDGLPISFTITDNTGGGLQDVNWELYGSNAYFVGNLSPDPDEWTENMCLSTDCYVLYVNNIPEGHIIDVAFSDFEGGGIVPYDQPGTYVFSIGGQAGCNDPVACNYNPNAICNAFGLAECLYPGCTNPQACNYQPAAGCNDGSCDMSSGAQVEFDGSTCHLTVTNSLDEVIYDQDIQGGFTNPNIVQYLTCLPFECLTFTVTGLSCYELFPGIPFEVCEHLYIYVNGNLIYDFDADDGISETQTICITQGCTDAAACNYDAEATTDDGSCGYIVGCTEPKAVNYNPNAICDDGNCVSEFGCTNPIACNYNSQAGIDDGSCDLLSTMTAVHIVNNNSGAANPVTITITSDAGIIYSATVAVGSVLDEQACLPFGCFSYGFTGQGLGDVAEFTTSSGDVIQLNGFGTSCVLAGCTDPAFCNYNFAANVEDGSCCNSNPCTALALFDGGQETLNGAVYTIYSGNNLIHTSTAHSVDEWYEGYCLADGCYTLEIIPNGVGNPISWTIDNASATQQSGSGAGTFSFVVGALGCTDPTACNYNINATCDDGTCNYGSPLIVRVTNLLSSPAPINFEFRAVFNGPVIASGSALPEGTAQDYEVCVPEQCLAFSISGLGAGDSYQIGTMQNNVFVQLLFTHNGGSFNTSQTSCCFIYGCTNFSACNPNNGATVNDGSCLTDCDYCVQLEMLDDGSEGLNGTHYKFYFGNFLMQEATSAQIDEFYSGLCVPEQYGCYTLEILDNGNNAGLEWSLLESNLNFIFSGTGPGVFALPIFGPVGCTEENAANYDDDADCDDGSCNFPGCIDSAACNFDSSAHQDDGTCQYGASYNLHFTNSALSNANVNFGVSNELGATILTGTIQVGVSDVALCLPDGCNQILFSGIGQGDEFTITHSENGFEVLAGSYQGLSNLFAEVCVQLTGCTNPEACNFIPTATIDDGSCATLNTTTGLSNDGNGGPIQFIMVDATGQMIAFGSSVNGQNTVEEYCLAEGCYEIIITGMVPGVFFGDMFSMLINGELLFAFVGANGTYAFCIESGCTDINACNYSVNAYYDDGSCAYTPSGCSDPAACNFTGGVFCVENCVYSSNAVLTIINGSTANVINYTISDIETSAILYQGTTTTNLVLPLCMSAGCYHVVVSGMQITSPVAVDFWELEFDGNEVASGNGSNPNESFCLVSGCTDINSCSYNPAATFEDGSCDDSMGIVVIVDYAGNASGYDLSYSVLHGATTTLAEFLIDDEFAGVHTQVYCIPLNCYTFYVAHLEANEHITVTDFDGNVLLDIEGPVESGAFSFCPGLGCTDVAACNYDVNAIQDDGSCLFGTSGCTDSFACNYDASATCYDGTCTYPGCTDVLACNYDVNAGCDDGSCLLEVILHINNFNPPSVTYNLFHPTTFVQYMNGFTPANQNFNTIIGCIPDECLTLDIHGLTSNDVWSLTIGGATIANGNTDGIFSICLHDGCKALAACNFDPAAVHDDGSCFFLDGDFDGNLVVNTSDLLLFMSGFGCSSGCAPYDLDGNGVTNTSDLLLFMSFFGSSC